MTQPEEQLLRALKSDLELYRDMIRETAKDMIDGQYTSYPIFVAHHMALPLGEMIFDREEYATTYSISASTLEEFEEKGLVQSANLNRFKQTYKDPRNYMCIFLISQSGGRFVFIPYEMTDTPDPEMN